MFRTNANNSSIFNSDFWFEPSTNRVFGVQTSGIPNKHYSGPNYSHIPQSAIDWYKLVTKTEGATEGAEGTTDEINGGEIDPALTVEDGADATKIGDVLDTEKDRYISGKQPVEKSNTTPNPLDELILAGNGDIADSYSGAEGRVVQPGYTRGGFAGKN